MRSKFFSATTPIHKEFSGRPQGLTAGDNNTNNLTQYFEKGNQWGSADLAGIPEKHQKQEKDMKNNINH